MSGEKELTLSDSTDKINEFNKMKRQKHNTNVPWYYAPAFLLFWFVLFFAVVIPIFFHLPAGLTVQNEHANSGEFIAERAERILIDFERIGPKVVGSFANENITVQLLHNEIAKIREVMQNDLFDLEVDVQTVSGAYNIWNVINMYQGVQNFVVKFSSKNSTSDKYLLLNSHFDSKPGSPGSGDDGAMVVVMLEILRVLATNRKTFKHPIIFLFNGAEENPLQASHGFITQHKWAKNCKALINLDSAGSGNREILFQTGPNQPWLVKYYSRYAKRPYATTMAEELFQANVIPSDTDFRIFRDYGHVPGLDLAHSYNGYVYHTKFDRMDIIPRGTLQATGDNVLALTRAFADAEELEDTSKHADGATVFYDFLGLVFIFYSETQGQIMNICIAVIAILLIGISLWRIASNSFISIKKLLGTFSVLLCLHVLGLVLSFVLPLIIGVLFDTGDRSMTWFANKWLVIGLYICPSLFGLSAPTLLYVWYARNDKLTQAYKVQMILHAHCVLLAVLCIILTLMGIRTSYLLMISLFFYACSLVLNLITTLHDRVYFWAILHTLGQVLPFLYFSYLFHSLLCSLMPMMGRFGTTTNPDLLMAGLCVLGTILALGFVIPLINIFRYPKSISLSLLVITFIFCMIAITPVGFPYRAKTNVGRVNFMHVRRVFYEYDKSVSRNETGYLFDFLDRRMQHSIEDYIDLSKMESISSDCKEYLMCGLPITARMYLPSKSAKWLPKDKPVELPATPKLKLLRKAVNTTTNAVRFEFELEGPPHMNIFLLPLANVITTDWSFMKTVLDNADPPYHISFSYGKDNSPLKFYLEFVKYDGEYNVPLFELGISGHYVSFEHKRDEANKKFIQSFPDYIYSIEWPSSYERYIF